MKLHSKLGKILSFTYLGIFTLFAVFAWQVAESGGIVVAVIALMATYPWFVIFELIFGALGYTSDMFTLFIPAILGALVQAVIIYGIGSIIGKLFSKKDTTTTSGPIN